MMSEWGEVERERAGSRVESCAGASPEDHDGS